VTIVMAALTVGPLLGCSTSKGADADRQIVLTTFQRSLAGSYSFTDTDTDRVQTTQVSGTVQDAYRHSLLLLVDGQPKWQEVVYDDAVADYFPDPKAVETYSGAGTSQYANAEGYEAPAVTPVTGAGGSPAPSASPTVVTKGSELPDQSTRDVVKKALLSGRWVLDPAGAPPLATQQGATTGVLTSPFYPALLSLSQAYDYLRLLPKGAVKRFEADSLTPVYKPAVDPFPAPTQGAVRYDVAEPPVTGAGVGQKFAPPLNISQVRKMAIYVKDAHVVQVRIVDDPTDRLQSIARAYVVPLASGLSNAEQQKAGEIIVNKVQATSSRPFRVHQEILTLSFEGRSATVKLPTSFVRGPLDLLPLHGLRAPG
jgi:hypothetical protein